MKRMNKRLLQQAYKQYLLSRGIKKSTVYVRTGCLRFFFRFLKENKKDRDVREITGDDLEDYIKHLDNYYSERRKKPLSESTKAGLYFTVKDLFSYLYANDLVLVNPAERVCYRKKNKGETRAILCQNDMNKLLDSMDNARDRAMYELMYSSGLRAGEVTRLRIGDIDIRERMVLVRQGKFSKDRVEPISQVSLLMLKKYLGARIRHKQYYVFPGQCGKMNKMTVNTRFKKQAEKANLYRENLCAHSIRHMTASHLLENGADLRYVQDLLGHSSIATTVKYTHFQYETLRKHYKSYHPKENEYYHETDREYVKRLEFLKARMAASRREKQEKKELHKQ